MSGTLNLPPAAMLAEIEACDQIVACCMPGDPMGEYYRQRGKTLAAKVHRLKAEGRFPLETPKALLHEE